MRGEFPPNPSEKKGLGEEQSFISLIGPIRTGLVLGLMKLAPPLALNCSQFVSSVLMWMLLVVLLSRIFWCMQSPQLAFGHIFHLFHTVLNCDWPFVVGAALIGI